MTAAAGWAENGETVSTIPMALRRLTILSTAILALGPAAQAGSAAVHDETVLAPVPKDFKVGFAADKGRLTMTEFVPQNETVDDWSRMITLQIFHGLSNADPDNFARGLKERWKTDCPGGDAQRLDAAADNRYAFSEWVYLCPLNPKTKKPENMWLKVISGKDALYSVQYAYRRDMGPDLMGPALDYLGKVKVCDTRLPDRPCPTIK